MNLNTFFILFYFIMNGRFFLITNKKILLFVLLFFLFGCQSISIKDIFANQAVNFYDFGEINIMPNDDVYANVNHPILGNIHTHSIYEIVCKEIEEGKSWFNIRNQAPCSNCIYQWLCPSPSDYEMAIGRPNLCHVK